MEYSLLGTIFLNLAIVIGSVTVILFIIFMLFLFIFFAKLYLEKKVTKKSQKKT